VLDREVDWFYNRLTIETQRGPDRIVCAIEPAGMACALTWVRDGNELVNLDLRFVSSLEIDATGGREMLTAGFDEDFLMPLRLQLKPRVHLFWRTRES
jgi:hypothetical protein